MHIRLALQIVGEFPDSKALADSVAREATAELRDNLTGLSDALGMVALETIRERLMWDLRGIFEPCCQLERSIAQALIGAGSNRNPRSARPVPSVEEILKHFPVARRLVNLLTRNWIDGMTAFAERWIAEFGRSAKVSSFGPETSDPHNGGQRVLVGIRVDGTKIVYKPRNLGLEQTFQHLVKEINARGFPWPLRTVEAVDRGDHGWMEYVRAQRCFGRAQVARYYLRAGALTCLFHAFHGVDGHTGNVISAGEQPVIIDLETLLHPPGKLGVSVFATGLLRVPDVPEYTIPAFGRPKPGKPEHFVEEIVEGFRVMAEFLRRQIDVAEWMGRFAGHPRRLILRTTEDYFQIRKQLLSPWLLNDETARRNNIARACEGVALAGMPSSQSVLETEALDRLDIPRIGTDGAPTLKPGRRFGTRKDVEEQIALIRSAFSVA